MGECNKHFHLHFMARMASFKIQNWDFLGSLLSVKSSQILVYWRVSPCSLIGGYRRFEGMYIALPPFLSAQVCRIIQANRNKGGHSDPQKEIWKWIPVRCSRNGRYWNPEEEAPLSSQMLVSATRFHGVTTQKTTRWIMTVMKKPQNLYEVKHLSIRLGVKEYMRS
jgi:hypothetical protein